MQATGTIYHLHLKMIDTRLRLQKNTAIGTNQSIPLKTNSGIEFSNLESFKYLFKIRDSLL